MTTKLKLVFISLLILMFFLFKSYRVFIITVCSKTVASLCISDRKHFVTLPEFTFHNSKRDQIFFLETSGKSYLSPRQCCAIESAALRSGLTVQVLLCSKFLDINLSICTHSLHDLVNNITFYSVNLERIFNDTPVEGIANRIDIAHRYGPTFLSDILRMVADFK